MTSDISPDPTPRVAGPHPRFVPERRFTAIVAGIAGIAVLATTFAAVPAALLVVLAAAWCLALGWFAQCGTSALGYTVIATFVKLATIALIVLAFTVPASPVGIKNGLFWIPLGTLNMGTGLWFLALIRGRAR